MFLLAFFILTILKSQNCFSENCHFQNETKISKIICNFDKPISLLTNWTQILSCKRIKIEGITEITFLKLCLFEATTDLDLSFNQIKLLSAEQFLQFPNLINLDLSHNQIFYFELNTFSGLNKLINLNLSYNQLVEIEDEDMDNMPQCEHINIDYNKFKIIR